jgi:hypothetical protein
MPFVKGSQPKEGATDRGMLQLRTMLLLSFWPEFNRAPFMQLDGFFESSKQTWESLPWMDRVDVVDILQNSNKKITASVKIWFASKDKSPKSR